MYIAVVAAVLVVVCVVIVVTSNTKHLLFKTINKTLEWNKTEENRITNVEIELIRL